MDSQRGIDVQCAATSPIISSTRPRSGKGQISVAGEIIGLKNTAGFTIPITEGSCGFRGAKGEFRSVTLSQSEARVTFADNDND